MPVSSSIASIFSIYEDAVLGKQEFFSKTCRILPKGEWFPQKIFSEGTKVFDHVWIVRPRPLN